MIQSNQANTMRYLLAAAVTMAMLVGPAHAQENEANKDPFKLKIEREEKERADNEKAYNIQMKRLKEQAPTETNTDPWKKVRPADNSGAKR